MKTRILSALFILGVSSLTLFAGNKTEKFKVAGNCGMCEARIEKAAKSVDGVSEADWNQETRMIEVTFDTSLTDLGAIHKAIAEAGHDTVQCSASDEVYEELPACCKYERMAVDKSSGS
ncbi:MAG: heavy-metal-associated domain-containing protein [Bacteroidales bacterium]|nr:heavy-metal-associated domain-containing protein [Bacteroidales bacterium]